MISKVTQNLNTNSNIRSSVHRETGFVEKRNLAVPFCEKFEKNVNNERLREPANVNFCGLSATPTKMEKFYRSNGLKKALEFATNQPLVFQASVALLFTCILRPGAIVLFPGEKNKGDQRYAAAHSIASGVIGFAISSIIFYPLGEAVKKFKDQDKMLENFGHLIKKDSILRNKDKFSASKAFVDRAPDIIGAIPKGILTVALIPPILKYVFGVEKKKSKLVKNDNLLTLDTSLLNFKSADSNQTKGGTK